MAKYRTNNAPERDSSTEVSKKTSERVRIGILVGVAALIVIAGMNLYETRRQRTELNDRMAQLVAAINTKPSTPAPSRGPDPAKVYTVRTDGSPSLGSKGAPITIVEFSDFQ
jgi:protein-disulfide isomerase